MQASLLGRPVKPLRHRITYVALSGSISGRRMYAYALDKITPHVDEAAAAKYIGGRRCVSQNQQTLGRGIAPQPPPLATNLLTSPQQAPSRPFWSRASHGDRGRDCKFALQIPFFFFASPCSAPPHWPLGSNPVLSEQEG